MSVIAYHDVNLLKCACYTGTFQYNSVLILNLCCCNKHYIALVFTVEVEFTVLSILIGGNSGELQFL